MTNAIISARISKVSSTFPLLSQKTLEDVLFFMGIDDSEVGLKLLEASTTGFEDFSIALSKANIPPQVTSIKTKAAWEILKGRDPFTSTTPKESQTDLAKAIEILKPVGQYSDTELLERYGKNCPIEIEEQLRKKTQGRPCIVFNENGEVDQENSLYMVRKARYEKTPRTYEIRGEIKELYSVGEFPMDILIECPIHSDVLLVEGYCEECGMKWIVSDKNYHDDYDRRVFLRLITESSDEPSDMRPYRKMSFDELKSNFPKVFLRYKEMKEEGKLPSMKRRLSKTQESDPFRVQVTHTRS